MAFRQEGVSQGEEMKKPPKSKLTEADITRQIRQYLNILGIWHWKVWQGPMSRPKGVADIIGILDGRFLAIEVKRPGAKLTEDQAIFLQKVRNNGGIGIVARDVSDVMGLMKSK